MFLNKKYFTLWFWIILILKLVVGSIWASNFMTDGFIPFVTYFVTSGLQNPYDYFVAMGQANAFPYPPMMLVIFSSIRFLFSWLPEQANLLVMRLPLLIADIVIYIILCRWLELKEKTVLWLYWASPVLFYINYVHGQLDVVPTALLLISLSLLFRRQNLLACLILGVGIATKTHLLAVMPFYFIYFYANRYPLKQLLGYVGASVVTAVALFGPYLWSSGFIQTVFGTTEAAKVYLVHLPFFENNLKLLLAPAAVFILFLNFFPYRKMNRDAFLLVLGLLFTVFVVFVPPMPGWLYWSLPFYVYFFAKYKEIPRLSFWFLTLSYLSYVMLSQGDIVIGNPLVLDLTFTCFIAALVMNAVWIYRLGVRSNLQYKTTVKPTLIGIGGDSGSGKNTLAKLLIDVFGKDQSMIMDGDDAHKWERHDANWEQLTHLDPKGNRLHQELNQAAGLKQGETVERSAYDHSTGRFTKPSNIQSNKNILYVGLHPFYLKRMRDMFDIKIYLDPAEELRRFWKLRRDQHDRGHTIADIEQQFSNRADDASKYIKPQRNFADIIVSLQLVEAAIADQLPVMKLVILCNNSIHLDPLLEPLAAVTGLSASHGYEDDLERQRLECTGTISAQQIQAIAHQGIPNFEELVTVSPQWHADYDGILQLFIFYYYSEIHKS